MYWLRKLLGKQGPWAGIANRHAVIYWEGRRKMTIAGEMLDNGFQIYVASITTWDDSKGELISESERQRILQNVIHSLESQGARVVID
jgi:hypothetical protein